MRRYIPDRRKDSDLCREMEERHRERLAILRGQRDAMFFALLELEERVRVLERKEGKPAPRVAALAILHVVRKEEETTGELGTVELGR